VTRAAAGVALPELGHGKSALLVEAGRNCWRVDRADRFYCIQDAAEYFRLVRLAILQARESVFILGWDIWAHLDLVPEGSDGEAPTRLDRVLAYAARRRPSLRCYILTWDYGALYTLERDPLSRWRLGWRMPRGVRFGFDDHHPIGASHHQKVIVIDDHLAFCGGIDLTGHRWDTPEHRVKEPARATALGLAYGPYHEVQAMLTGPAASALGVLARDRWHEVGARGISPLGTSGTAFWPSDLEPDLTNVEVGIARTIPPAEGRPAVRECEALFYESIARAQHTIYIESQYFTNDKLAAALAARLSEPAGPEIIVVSPRDCHGWLEQTTMCAFRASAFRELIAADRHRRLRLVSPLASRTADVPTFVHSKVMIVDDVLARIGSANFSHRSMGMDTECDVAADAGGDPDRRAGIRRIRDRLLAEHLGLPADVLFKEIERAGSIGAVLDAHADGDRTLTALDISDEPAASSDLLRVAADPDEPMGFGVAVEQFLPALDARRGQDPLRLWILPTVALAAAAVVGWRSTEFLRPELGSLQELLAWIPRDAAAVRLGASMLLLASLVLVPLELLAIAAGVLFGAAAGAIVAFAGACAAAIIGYVAGRRVGPGRLGNWVSTRASRTARQLGARGVTSVVALRLAGLASAASIHLMCGAARVPFGAFLAGTVLGFVPVVAALVGLGALLRHTILQPSIGFAALTIGAAVLLMALTAGVRTLLVMRQFASSMSRQRDRAEFG
jgi:phospholipase D1/2